METFGYFPFDQNSSSVSKLGQMVRKFPGKVSAKSENYQLPKFEPLDLKFREQHHMKRKFKVKKSK